MKKSKRHDSPPSSSSSSSLSKKTKLVASLLTAFDYSNDGTKVIRKGQDGEETVSFGSEDFVVNRVPGDGSCFFHALYDQLQNRAPQLLSKDDDAGTLREGAVNNIVENWDHYQSFFFDKGKGPDAIIASLLNSRTWAENPIIQATANMLNIHISIHQKDRDYTNTLHVHPLSSSSSSSSPPTLPTLHFLNQGSKGPNGFVGMHFDSLLDSEKPVQRYISSAMTKEAKAFAEIDFSKIFAMYKSSLSASSSSSSSSLSLSSKTKKKKRIDNDDKKTSSKKRKSDDDDNDDNDDAHTKSLSKKSLKNTSQLRAPRLNPENVVNFHKSQVSEIMNQINKNFKRTESPTLLQPDRDFLSYLYVTYKNPLDQHEKLLNKSQLREAGFLKPPEMTAKEIAKVRLTENIPKHIERQTTAPEPITIDTVTKSASTKEEKKCVSTIYKYYHKKWLARFAVYKERSFASLPPVLSKRILDCIKKVRNIPFHISMEFAKITGLKRYSNQAVIPKILDRNKKRYEEDVLLETEGLNASLAMQVIDATKSYDAFKSNAMLISKLHNDKLKPDKKKSDEEIESKVIEDFKNGQDVMQANILADIKTKEPKERNVNYIVLYFLRHLSYNEYDKFIVIDKARAFFKELERIDPEWVKEEEIENLAVNHRKKLYESYNAYSKRRDEIDFKQPEKYQLVQEDRIKKSLQHFDEEDDDGKTWADILDYFKWYLPYEGTAKRAIYFHQKIKGMFPAYFQKHKLYNDKEKEVSDKDGDDDDEDGDGDDDGDDDDDDDDNEFIEERDFDDKQAKGTDMQQQPLIFGDFSLPNPVKRVATQTQSKKEAKKEAKKDEDYIDPSPAAKEIRLKEEATITNILLPEIDSIELLQEVFTGLEDKQQIVEEYVKNYYRSNFLREQILQKLHRLDEDSAENIIELTNLFDIFEKAVIEEKFKEFLAKDAFLFLSNIYNKKDISTYLAKNNCDTSIFDKFISPDLIMQMCEKQRGGARKAMKSRKKKRQCRRRPKKWSWYGGGDDNELSDLTHPTNLLDQSHPPPLVSEPLLSQPVSLVSKKKTRTKSRCPEFNTNQSECELREECRAYPSRTNFQKCRKTSTPKMESGCRNLTAETCEAEMGSNNRSKCYKYGSSLKNNFRCQKRPETKAKKSHKILYRPKYMQKMLMNPVGAPAAERIGAPAAERIGAPAAERVGAPAAERDPESATSADVNRQKLRETLRAIRRKRAAAAAAAEGPASADVNRQKLRETRRAILRGDLASPHLIKI